jgi:hypothetical protein
MLAAHRNSDKAACTVCGASSSTAFRPPQLNGTTSAMLDYSGYTGYTGPQRLYWSAAAPLHSQQLN